MRLHARRLFHKGHEPAVEQTTPKRADTARQERGGYGADTDAHHSTRTHKPVDQCDTYTAPVKEILCLTKFTVKHLGERLHHAVRRNGDEPRGNDQRHAERRACIHYNAATQE